LIADAKHITSSGFQKVGDAIVLLGDWGWEIAATSYLQEIHDLKRGQPPEINFEREKALHDAVRSLIRLGEVRSAHDLSDGGLAVALAECCLTGKTPHGAQISLPTSQRLDVTLFNETQSRALITVRRENATAVLEVLARRGVPAQVIGQVTAKDLVLQHGSQALTWTLDDLQQAWGESLGHLMES
jgi:phosphoribosylformylglycinamidine synthase